jgi:hypothetical protein
VIISVSAIFADVLYMLFLAPSPLPLDTLGGLALPISGSSGLRDLTNFCAFSL